MQQKRKRIKEIVYNLLPQAGLVIFLLIGIAVYKDYGLGWDEFAQMTERGGVNYNFMTTGDKETFLKSPGIYQGPAFDLCLVTLQHFFNITDSREIYFFRHLVTFLFFWLSGLAFYFLLRKKYSDRFVIFIGICWFFLMPRIFADSFDNTKDLPFLAMTVICLLSLTRFLEKPSWKTGILHGLFSGFLIDIRLMGVLMPAVTAAMFLLRILSAEKKIKITRSYFIPSIWFILSMAGFMVLFWPVLWLGPLHHFIAGWKEMSVFNFATTTLFQEQYIYTNQLPWYYDAFWMLITTPIQYICFFIIGLCFTLFNIFSFKKVRIFNFETEISSFLVFFVPLITIILLHSSEYDGWRHVFYVFVPFCIIALRGLYEIKSRLVKYINAVWIDLTVVALTLQVAYSMAQLHPYENMYFNRIIGPDAQSVKFKYEMDYWGLAFREALEKLYLKSSKDAKIVVYAMNAPGVLSVGILPENMRSKFIFTSYKKASYFIHDYRWDPQEFNQEERVDSIKVDGAVISSTYRLGDETSKTTTLKTMNGNYLSVSRSSDRLVFADRNSTNKTELFTIIYLRDTTCAIYSSEGKYLTAELGKQGEITASRDIMAGWEIFSIVQVDSHHIVFKAANDKYISVDPKSLQLFARSDSIGENEEFELIIK